MRDNSKIRSFTRDHRPTRPLPSSITDCTQKIQQLQTAALDMNKQLHELNKLLGAIKKRVL